MSWRKWLKPWWAKGIAIVTAWIVIFSVDITYHRTTQLSPRLRLIERVHVRRSPISGFAEAFRSVLLPIPASISRVDARRVMLGDTVIWQSITDPRGLELGLYLAPSPDERSLLIWAIATDRRWRIISIPARDSIPVSPLLPRTVGTSADLDMYLPDFRRWSPDSRQVYAVIDGSDSDTLRRTPESGVILIAFREMWTIDASDGRAERIRRCEQPSPPMGSARWELTACADTATFAR